MSRKTWASRRGNSTLAFAVLSAALLSGMGVMAVAAPVDAQNAPKEGGYQRSFPQSKAAVEKALQQIQSSISGHLPGLDGFANSAGHPLDRYQRAYFQSQVQVSAAPGGGSIVRVSAKVTAFYVDPAGSKSGYQLLPSNGRLEGDLLDQLDEQLSGAVVSKSGTEEASREPTPLPRSSRAEPANTANNETNNEPALAAPMPRLPDTRGGISSSLSQTLAEQEKARNKNGKDSRKIEDESGGPLEAELKSLQEVLKNQSKPNNLVAVKDSGTPVVASASLTARTLFMASAHDEFELLDFNRDWVHVKISGLSRGWIWRNNLEMPDNIPDSDLPQGRDVAPPAVTMFHVTREEVAQFPGDWAPLRGKNVKIVSVEQTDENAKDMDPKFRLEFAKALLTKDYAELVQKKEDVAGIVLIFDAADGGMIGTTLATLQDWKAGGLTDAALWHRSFFDPPESFTPAGTAAASR